MSENSGAAPFDESVADGKTRSFDEIAADAGRVYAGVRNGSYEPKSDVAAILAEAGKAFTEHNAAHDIAMPDETTETDGESFFRKHRKALSIILGVAMAIEAGTWGLVSQFSSVAAAHILFNLNWLGHTLNFVFIAAEAITFLPTAFAVGLTIKEADIHFNFNLCGKDPNDDEFAPLEPPKIEFDDSGHQISFDA
jgi:hypothetical protein